MHFSSPTRLPPVGACCRGIIDITLPPVVRVPLVQTIGQAKYCAFTLCTLHRFTFAGPLVTVIASFSSSSSLCLGVCHANHMPRSCSHDRFYSLPCRRCGGLD